MSRHRVLAGSGIGFVAAMLISCTAPATGLATAPATAPVQPLATSNTTKAAEVENAEDALQSAAVVQVMLRFNHSSQKVVICVGNVVVDDDASLESELKKIGTRPRPPGVQGPLVILDAKADV